LSNLAWKGGGGILQNTIAVTRQVIEKQHGAQTKTWPKTQEVDPLEITESAEESIEETKGDAVVCTAFIEEEESDTSEMECLRE
jgi:hypothetical protein